MTQFKKKIQLALLLICPLILEVGLAQTSEKKRDKYTFKTILVHNQTWGYNIYVNDMLKIHQPTIPGRAGNEGFKTKEDAEKTARLVIEKMKKGEMPPTVRIDEFKRLRIE